MNKDFPDWAKTIYLNNDKIKVLSKIISSTDFLKGNNIYYMRAQLVGEYLENEA